MPIQKYKTITGLYLVLVIASIALFVYNKPAAFILSYYHVSNFSAHSLSYSLLLPYIFEAIFALIAYLCICKYDDMLEFGQEKNAFRDFRRAQFFVALNIAITPLLSEFVSRIESADSPHAAEAAIVARYANIAILIYAAAMLYRASRRLLEIIQYDGPPVYVITAVICAGLAIIFALLGPRYLSQSSTHPHPLLNLMYPISYRESGTIIRYATLIPGLVAWCIFGLAAQNFIVFQRKVKGTLYKKAFSGIAGGIIVSVLSVAFLHTLQLTPFAYGHTNPLPLLAVTYCIGLIGIIGFGLYVHGVNKLCTIEEA